MFIIFLSFLLKVQRTTSHFGTESRVCCRFSRRRFFSFFFLPLRWLNEEVCNSRRDFIFAWQRWHLRLFKFKTLSSRRCWAEQRDPMWTRGMLKSAWNLAEGFRCQAQQKGAIELEFARGERTPENTHTRTHTHGRWERRIIFKLHLARLSLLLLYWFPDTGMRGEHATY